MKTNVFFWAGNRGFEGIEYGHNSIVDEDPFEVAKKIMIARPDLYVMISNVRFLDTVDDEIRIVCIDNRMFNQR